MSRGSSLLRALLDGVLSALSQGQRSSQEGRPGTAAGGSRASRAEWKRRGPAETAARTEPRTGGDDSPGRNGNGATRDLTRDELRAIRPSYAPKLDGEPDPGEVIWTWVPYVEQDGRGKDRPVLILARLDAMSWAACYLSTKHHSGFVSVGTGSWDSQGRESFLSPERVLRVTDAGMRRESTGIDRASYDRAVQAVMRWHRLV